MLPGSLWNVVGFTVGAGLGFGMGRQGLSPFDPETQWTAIGTMLCVDLLWEAVTTYVR